MRTLALLPLLLLCGCASHLKQCQVERISFAYREEMLDCLTNHPAMMMDLLKTIATLEQEAGGYQ